MNFSIGLTDSAVEDLEFFPKKERRMIADGIVAVGQKEHNDLYIRGKKVEL